MSDRKFTVQDVFHEAYEYDLTGMLSKEGELRLMLRQVVDKSIEVSNKSTEVIEKLEAERKSLKHRLRIAEEKPMKMNLERRQVNCEKVNQALSGNKTDE